MTQTCARAWALTRVALAQTASQTATKQHLKTLSFISASQQIWQARGFAGFYAGYPVKVRTIFTRLERWRRHPRNSTPFLQVLHHGATGGLTALMVLLLKVRVVPLESSDEKTPARESLSPAPPHVHSQSMQWESPDDAAHHAGLVNDAPYISEGIERCVPHAITWKWTAL